MADFVIDTWFPSSIYKAYGVVSEEENQRVLAKVLALEKIIEPGGKAWKSNTFNSRHTYDFLADEDFKPITEQVSRHVAEYAKAFNSTYPYQCASAWFNVAHEHAYQEFHIHPNSVFSAIYYASCPEGSGNVVFEKDQVDMMPVKGVQSFNALTFTTCSYKPVQGMLLIFRSSLRHMVQVGSNTEPRVSLSFNFA
jgi:uncharacterized protein (TIGR02466 family)